MEVNTTGTGSIKVKFFLKKNSIFFIYYINKSNCY